MTSVVVVDPPSGSAAAESTSDTPAPDSSTTMDQAAATTSSAAPQVATPPQQHPPPSPLSGCYLLVVLPEPHCSQHRDLILNRLAKGFLSWDKDSCHVDLEKELQALVAQAPEGEEARNGERLIQYATENLVTEVLIFPQSNTLLQCMRNLLASFTKHRHIVHAGYTFGGNGSWILQDGTFSLADFLDAFSEHEVQRVLRAYENSVTVDIHCAGVGDWSTARLAEEACTRACRVRVNPDDVLTAGCPAIQSFTAYLGQYLVAQTLDQLMEPSDVVGNIRFSHPTLYVFPGGQGDAALFGINGFNMLVDGGFARKACFWDFARHLDRLDAVLLTRINNSNIGGMASVLQKKKEMHVYPQIGHFFCNIVERKNSNSPDGDKDIDPLILNLIDIGQEMAVNLRHINLRPHLCYRDPEPINLYHKVGHGTLDMYVLSPSKDSREVRDFMAKWNASDAKLFAGSHGTRGGKSGGGDSTTSSMIFPVQNLVSICALLVWQPASPEETITRILFPGSTPQHKIFEGFGRLKHLEFLKHPVCTAKSLSPSASLVALKDKAGAAATSIAMKPKFSLYERETKRLAESRKRELSSKRDATIEETAAKITAAAATKPVAAPISVLRAETKTKKIVENKKIESEAKEGKLAEKESREIIKKDVKKIEKSDKIEAETKKTDTVKADTEKITVTKESKVQKIETKKREIKEITKSTVKTTKSESIIKASSKPIEKKIKVSGEKKDVMKPSPTTPKKSLNVLASKVEVTRTVMKAKPKAVSKTTSSVPAKSAKEANNRKVVEQKNIELSTAASSTAATASSAAKSTVKAKTVERKAVGIRGRTISPSKKLPLSPAKSTRSTPSSVKSEKDAVIRKIRGGTTDSSAVSTPSGIDSESAIKVVDKNLTEKSEDMSLDSIESKVLADLKEEREVVEEIEAVLQKAERIEVAKKEERFGAEDEILVETVDKKGEETEDDVTAEMDDAPKKLTRKESQELTEEEEYLIVEKEEIYTEDSMQSGDTEQKHHLDEVESEKAHMKISGESHTAGKELQQHEEKEAAEEKLDEVPEKLLAAAGTHEELQKSEDSPLQHKEQLEEEMKQIIATATETVQQTEEKDDSPKKESDDAAKEASSSPDKLDSPPKPEGDQKDVLVDKLVESQERVSILESGATTTAPSLPEDERTPLDEIKEDIDEKHVLEDVKEKEKPVPEPEKIDQDLPVAAPKPEVKELNVKSAVAQGVARDIVKTPDEVADLPVHEEVDPKLYSLQNIEKDKEVDQSDKQKDVPISPTVKDHKEKGFFGKMADKFEKGFDKLTKKRRDSEKDIEEKPSSKASSPKESKPEVQQDVADEMPIFEKMGSASIRKSSVHEDTQLHTDEAKTSAISESATFIDKEIQSANVIKQSEENAYIQSIIDDNKAEKEDCKIIEGVTDVENIESAVKETESEPVKFTIPSSEENDDDEDISDGPVRDFKEAVRDVAGVLVGTAGIEIEMEKPKEVEEIVKTVAEVLKDDFLTEKTLYATEEARKSSVDIDLIPKKVGITEEVTLQEEIEVSSEKESEKIVPISYEKAEMVQEEICTKTIKREDVHLSSPVKEEVLDRQDVLKICDDLLQYDIVDKPCVKSESDHKLDVLAAGLEEVCVKQVAKREVRDENVGDQLIVQSEISIQQNLSPSEAELVMVTPGSTPTSPKLATEEPTDFPTHKDDKIPKELTMDEITSAIDSQIVEGTSTIIDKISLEGDEKVVESKVELQSVSLKSEVQSELFESVDVPTTEKYLDEAKEKVISETTKERDEKISETVQESQDKTVTRMVVTASSEDGGHEIEICESGTISFTKSPSPEDSLKESRDRSPPEKDSLRSVSSTPERDSIASEKLDTEDQKVTFDDSLEKLSKLETDTTESAVSVDQKVLVETFSVSTIESGEAAKTPESLRSEDASPAESMFAKSPTDKISHAYEFEATTDQLHQESIKSKSPSEERDLDQKNTASVVPETTEISSDRKSPSVEKDSSRKESLSQKVDISIQESSQFMSNLEKESTMEENLTGQEIQSQDKKSDTRSKSSSAERELSHKDESKSPSAEKDDLDRSKSPSVEKDKSDRSKSSSAEKDVADGTKSPSADKDHLHRSKSPSVEKDQLDRSKSPSAEKDNLDGSKSPNVEKDKLDRSKSPSVEKDKLDRSKSPSAEKDDVDRSKSPSVDKDKIDRSKSPSAEKDDIDRSKSPSVDKDKSDRSKSPSAEKDLSSKETSPQKLITADDINISSVTESKDKKVDRSKSPSIEKESASRTSISSVLAESSNILVGEHSQFPQTSDLEKQLAHESFAEQFSSSINEKGTSLDKSRSPSAEKESTQKETTPEPLQSKSPSAEKEISRKESASGKSQLPSVEIEVDQKEPSPEKTISMHTEKESVKEKLAQDAISTEVSSFDTFTSVSHESSTLVKDTGAAEIAPTESSQESNVLEESLSSVKAISSDIFAQSFGDNSQLNVDDQVSLVKESKVLRDEFTALGSSLLGKIETVIKKEEVLVDKVATDIISGGESLIDSFSSSFKEVMDPITSHISTSEQTIAKIDGKSELPDSSKGISDIDSLIKGIESHVTSTIKSEVESVSNFMSAKLEDSSNKLLATASGILADTESQLLETIKAVEKEESEIIKLEEQLISEKPSSKQESKSPSIEKEIKAHEAVTEILQVAIADDVKSPSTEKESISKETSPEKSIEKESSPIKSVSKEATPEKSIEKEASPAKLISKEASPEKSIEKEASPSKSVSKEASPAKSISKEATPEKSIEKEASPTKSISKEASPEKSIGKEASPEKTISKEPSPEKSIEREASPAKTISKETSPEKLIEKEASPEKSISKEATPEKSIEKEASPSKSVSKEASPEKSIEKEASPEKSISKEATPEKSIEREASPAKTISKEASPEKSIGKEASPEKTISKEPSPDKSIEREASPAITISKDASPEKLIEKEASPAKSISKEPTPEKSIEKEASPTRSVSKEASPEKSISKEGSPDKLIGKEASSAKSIEKESSPAKSISSIDENLLVSLAQSEDKSDRSKSPSVEKESGQQEGTSSKSKSPSIEREVSLDKRTSSISMESQVTEIANFQTQEKSKSPSVEKEITKTESSLLTSIQHEHDDASKSKSPSPQKELSTKESSPAKSDTSDVHRSKSPSVEKDSTKHSEKEPSPAKSTSTVMDQEQSVLSQHESSPAKSLDDRQAHERKQSISEAERVRRESHSEDAPAKSLDDRQAHERKQSISEAERVRRESHSEDASAKSLDDRQAHERKQSISEAERVRRESHSEDAPAKSLDDRQAHERKQSISEAERVRRESHDDSSAAKSIDDRQAYERKVSISEAERVRRESHSEDAPAKSLDDRQAHERKQSISEAERVRRESHSEDAPAKSLDDRQAHERKQSISEAERMRRESHSEDASAKNIDDQQAYERKFSISEAERIRRESHSEDAPAKNIEDQQAYERKFSISEAERVRRESHSEDAPAKNVDDRQAYERKVSISEAERVRRESHSEDAPAKNLDDRQAYERKVSISSSVESQYGDRQTDRSRSQSLYETGEKSPFVLSRTASSIEERHADEFGAVGYSFDESQKESDENEEIIASYIFDEYISKNKKISLKELEELARAQSIPRQYIILIIENVITRRKLSRQSILADDFPSSQGAQLPPLMADIWFDSSDDNHHQQQQQHQESSRKASSSATDKELKAFIESETMGSSPEPDQYKFSSADRPEPHIDEEIVISEEKRTDVESLIFEEYIRHSRKLTDLILEEIVRRTSVPRYIILEIIEEIVVKKSLNREAIADSGIFQDVDDDDNSQQQQQTKQQKSGQSSPDLLEEQYEDSVDKSIPYTDYESPFHKAFVGGMTEIRTTHITTTLSGGKSTTPPDSDEKSSSATGTRRKSSAISEKLLADVSEEATSQQQQQQQIGSTFGATSLEDITIVTTTTVKTIISESTAQPITAPSSGGAGADQQLISLESHSTAAGLPSSSFTSSSSTFCQETRTILESVMDHGLAEQPLIRDLINDDKSTYSGKSSPDVSLPKDIVYGSGGGSTGKSTPDITMSPLIQAHFSGRSTPASAASTTGGGGDKQHPLSRTATPEGFRSGEVIRTIVTTTRTMSDDGDIITTTQEVTEATNERGETVVLAQKTDVKVDERAGSAAGAGPVAEIKSLESSHHARTPSEGSDLFDREVAGGGALPPVSPRSDLSTAGNSRAVTHVWGSSEERHTFSDDDPTGSPMFSSSPLRTATTVTADSGLKKQLDDFTTSGLMSSSFYGELPDETTTTTVSTEFMVEKEPMISGGSSSFKRYIDEADLDFEKALSDVSTKDEAPAAQSSSKDDESKDKKRDPLADWGSPLGLPSPRPPRKFNLKSSPVQPCSSADLSPDSLNFDVINDWGEPMRLPPTPAPAQATAGAGSEASSNKPSPATPKKEPPRQPKRVLAENIKNKRSESPGKYDKRSKDSRNKIQPVYVDLTYVSHHGNSFYTALDFFKKVRARYYVFSGTEPSREVYDALLEAKKTWEDKDLEVTMIPTYDTDTLGYWVADNEEALAAHHIDLSPSASRCTINLQDHETSCSAYRLEF
ncbi:microtubule-associated protein futsch isoform X2 [Trichogramma pretiosum]|uniref:microtubule-associated protein futsch isoform X2 n=1 Tax=Trichogramma pretiosum TaxID=7493 RepID=UPI000C71989F|nr:microtubule-associated protein futsch isoform X2 [Trichogramma pretiosum]